MPAVIRKTASSPKLSAREPEAAGPTTHPTPKRSRAALKPVEDRSRKTAELHTDRMALMTITPAPKSTADAPTAGGQPGAITGNPAATPRAASATESTRRRPKRATASPVSKPAKPAIPRTVFPGRRCGVWRGGLPPPGHVSRGAEGIVVGPQRGVWWGAGAAEALNELLAGSAALRACFDPEGEPTLESAVGPEVVVGEIMGRVAAAVVVAACEGTWRRLKACRNEGCLWAFYDRSKNRSGSWCTMDVCGARAKMSAYRRRKT